jgi:hydrogenase maturation protease
MKGTILVAGSGNIFNRDDAFGVTVASRLAEIELPANVFVVDFGIRGFDLMLALLDGFELTIFVDAVSRGGEPGMLYLIEHDASAENADGGVDFIDNAHGLNPLKVLESARSLGAAPRRVFVVGCEPESLGDDTGRIGLSERVERAVPEAIGMIQSLIEQFNHARAEFVEASWVGEGVTL